MPDIDYYAEDSQPTNLNRYDNGGHLVGNGKIENKQGSEEDRQTGKRQTFH